MISFSTVSSVQRSSTCIADPAGGLIHVPLVNMVFTYLCNIKIKIYYIYLKYKYVI